MSEATKITSLNALDFCKWNKISYDGRKITKGFGSRAFFYYRSADAALYCKNFSAWQRFKHCFGYEKKYNAKSFWKFLQVKHLTNAKNPVNSKIEKVISQKLRAISSLKNEFMRKVYDKGVADAELKALFAKGLSPHGKIGAITPLFEAALHGRLDLLAYLLEKGADADLDVVCDAGVSAKTPLQAALSIRHETMALALLEKGAGVNAQDSHGKSALHAVIDNISTRTQQDNNYILKFILSRKPDFSVLDAADHTALSSACSKGLTNVVKLLIAEGADPNFAANKQNLPLVIACVRGDLELARLLLKHGAKMPDANERNLIRLVLYAVHDIKKEFIELLLLNGADATTPGLVARAAENGNPEVVELLLQHGASIDAIGYAKSALFNAAAHGDLPMVRLLLARGADLALPVNQSVLAEARQKGHAEIVAVLEAHIAGMV